MGVIRWLRRLFWLAVALFAAACVTVLVPQWRSKDTGDDPKPARLAIVLGAGTSPDGILTYYSRMRVRRGVEMLESGQVGTLVMSDGTQARGATAATADLMHELALSLGAPADRLIVEPRARNTLENMLFGFRIADTKGAARDGADVVVVTDSYHMARVLIFARYLGRGAVRGIAADRDLRMGPFARAIRTVYEAGGLLFNVYRIARWEIAGRPDPAAGS